MDDKRTQLAIVLSLLVVIFYWRVVFPAHEAPPTTPPALQQSSPSPSPAAQNAPSHSAPMAATSVAPTAESLPNAAQIASSTVTTIATNKIRLEITHLGARARSLQLRQHKAQANLPDPYQLVHTTDSSPLPLGVYFGEQSDALVGYTLEGVSRPVDSATGLIELGMNDDLSLNFVGSLPDGTRIRKIFHITGNSYLFTLEVTVDRPTTDGSKVWLEWSHYLPQEIVSQSYNQSAIKVLEDSSVSTHLLSGVAPETLESSVGRWIGIGDYYFIAAVVAPQSGQLRYENNNFDFLIRAAGTDKGGNYSIYAGPKQHKEMVPYKLSLEKSIDLGWFTFLAYPLLVVLRFFYSQLSNYGLAIVLLTIAIKAIFLPLTQASLRSMRAMQDLQPEIKALRDRIKDPTQLNQEMLALYKKRGVNPLGGCFPMLIQIPVFLGLYNALLNAIELRHAPFALWIQDLSEPEYLTLLGIPIPVMLLVMGISMFIQQWLTPTPNMDPTQRKIMLFMPVIFTIMFIAIPLPAGLVLYWLVNNFMSIIQQLSLYRPTKVSPVQATAIGGVVIFLGAYLLTLI